jgi:regulatory protein
MKILSVTQYKGSTFRVEIEDQPDVYINSSTVEKFNLKADMNIPESALEEIKASDLERKARSRAMHLLTARDYSFVELFGKLSSNYSRELCLDVCRYMAEMGYINDREYARKLARQLFEVKKYGVIKAKFEMKRRGLTPNVVEEALEPYVDDSSTHERLEELVEKKYEKYLTDAKGVQKVKSALARAGYTYDSINSVLNLYDLEFEKQ